MHTKMSINSSFWSDTESHWMETRLEHIMAYECNGAVLPFKKRQRGLYSGRYLRLQNEMNRTSTTIYIIKNKNKTLTLKSSD